MRTLAALLCVLSLVIVSGCRRGQQYGEQFTAPYVAAVPAGWKQSHCADENAIWLEDNDVMWIPHDAPRCHSREFRDSRGTITFRDINIPTKALIFCSARRIKDAPSTYCDTARILHWRDAKTVADVPTVLCRGLRGRAITLTGRVGPYSAIAETVNATVRGTTYFAMYLHGDDDAPDPRAANSPSSICPR